MNFDAFKAAVARQFERLQAANTMFRMETDKDELYATYLASFPPGTNEIYRERTVHDCTCCKQFIRAVGNAVAFIDGKIETVWDIKLNGEYQIVADALAAKVRESRTIAGKFLHFENRAGTDRSFEKLESGQKEWSHFFVNIKRQYVSNNIAAEMGEFRETVQVFKRGLNELTLDAVDQVQELIDQNSLLRGEEKKFALSEFRKQKVAFDKLKSDDAREIFAWVRATTIPASVARFRNDVIGTLVTDLSDGVDLEVAVKKFEDKVSGTNYKRPTALITPSMIEKAKKTVNELGLTSALDRRYATLSDITINNILFANRDAKARINGDAFDALADETSAQVKAKTFDKVESISIDKFIANVLPKAKVVEVLLENRHLPNMASLVAPVDPTAGRLFKWNNNFSWSYNGEFADSIKEKVKNAGGNVEGDLCCRLAWFNHDDLDLHLITPSGDEICFHNKRGRGVELDVDMNAGYGRTREPVENIVYANEQDMEEGEYSLFVNQYNQRESSNVGFEAQIDFKGEVITFSYDKVVRRDVEIARFKYSRKKGLEIIESLPSTTKSKTVWSLPTQSFHPVSIMLMSPNHWDDQGIGNRHFFFMLHGAKADQPARGFYNEFLNSFADQHRKVFEVLGSRMKVQDSDDQLSGLGFSSTQRNHVIVRVQGATIRTLKVEI